MTYDDPLRRCDTPKSGLRFNQYLPQIRECFACIGLDCRSHFFNVEVLGARVTLPF